MKQVKKLLAFLLAFAMLASMAVAPVWAADFNDVPESHPYYDAIQSLVVRGVINGYADGTFKPDATITRAEFCKMVIFALNLGSVAEGEVTETGFPDVATNHWAASNIKVAYDMGIINGFDDGTFKPEENVTFEQSVKMVVCAASDKLKQMADANGGYPEGYLRVAQGYQFLRNISASNTAPAPRGVIAKLMDNMLKADLSDMGGTTGPSGRGENNGATIGTLREVKGQIVSIYGASILSAEDSVPKDSIKMLLSTGEEVIYSAKNLSIKNNLYDYLGKLVIAYYTYDDGVNTQILSNLTLQRSKNDENVVGVDQIQAGYSNTDVMYYDEDGDEVDISIDPSAKIMFNGRLATESFKTLLDANIANTGSIRFLSSKGSGTADVVFFTVYENIYVTSITSSTNTVYGEGGVKYVIDDEDRSKVVTILKNGQSVSFSSIAKGQILSISQSRDGKVMEVLISTEAPSGRVSGLTRAEKEIILGGKTYTFANNVTMGTDITTGSNLKLYLDAFGKIAKYEFVASSTSYTYAYLMDFQNFGTSLAANVQMEVLNLNGTTIKGATPLKLGDTLLLNNVNYDVAREYDKIVSVLSAAAAQYNYGADYTLAAGELYQPIKYSESNNVVKEILVGKPIAESTNADIKIDTVGLSGIKCTTTNTVLSGIYNLNSGTKVLMVPVDRSDVDEYTLKTGTNSGFVAGDTYNVLLVDVNKSDVPALVVVYVGDSTLNVTNEWVNNYPGVVIRKSLVPAGNQLTVLMHTGEEVYIDEGTSFYNQVEIGDIVRIAADSSGQIEEMEVVADATEIYAGNEFIKIPSARVASLNIFTGDSGTTRRIREGDRKDQDTAVMSLLAGTVYEVVDDTLKMALEYTVNGSMADQLTLGEAGKMQNLSAGSAKVVAVEFDAAGEVDNVDTEADLTQLAAYTKVGGSADKVFVYRARSSVELVVVFRPVQ